MSLGHFWEGRRDCENPGVPAARRAGRAVRHASRRRRRSPRRGRSVAAARSAACFRLITSPCARPSSGQWKTRPRRATPLARSTPLVSSHFKHEEELALRPLGLLRGIARDASSADVASAIAMAGKIEQDLPQLLDEHRVILESSTTTRRRGASRAQAPVPRPRRPAVAARPHRRGGPVSGGDSARRASASHAGGEATTQVTEAIMMAMKTSARLLMLAALAAVIAAPASAQTPRSRAFRRSAGQRPVGFQDLLRELSRRVRPRQRGRRDLPATPACRPHADCDTQQGHVSGGPGVPR